MRALGIVLVLGACFSKPGFRGDAGGDGSITPPTPISSKLSAGAGHVCQIDAQNQLWCWGANFHGQLGPMAGAMSSTATPVKVGAAAGWDWISAGSDYTCGITAGEVKCWGRNNMGQSLPGGPDTDVALGMAVTLPTQEKATRVFAGNLTTCAITESGATYCWGDLDFTTTPQGVRRLSGSDLFVQVAFGEDHACAVRDLGGGFGTATCWGKNDHLQLGSMSGDLTFDAAATVDNASRSFGSIAASTTATCATTIEGQLVCWGSNQYGQLGPGVSADTRDAVVDATNTWISVTMRDQQTCALTTAGDAYCFGDAASGALGRGSYAGARALGTPVLTASSAITTGDEVTCARSTKDPTMGDVWCWGANDLGQIGNKQIAQHDDPVEVALPIAQDDFIQKIVAGDDHTCVLVGPSGGDEYAYCWGRNDKNQVTNGNGTAQPNVIATPVKVMSPDDLSSLAAGAEHTCAILANQAIYCWGSNASGQLGRVTTSMNGDNTVAALSNGYWDTIAAGNAVTCAISDIGELWCWGAVYGESGPFLMPHKYGLSGTWRWDQLAIGTGAVIGVALDPSMSNQKHITGWGNKCQEDQAGAPSDPTATSQAQILDGPARYGISIAVAQTQGSHACALMKATMSAIPTLECWGMNTSHQIDDGSTVGCRGDSPVVPPGSVHWHDPDAQLNMVVAAGNHSCALAADNMAYCWGANTNHVLGALPSDGTPKVFMDLRWSELATGGTHTCGIDDLNKHVLCWGQGKFGQLGDGSRYWPAPTPGGLIQ